MDISNIARVRKGMASHLANNYVIMADVLSRLPVKTLSRFNSVCKLWYRMIHSNLGFQALHYSRSRRNPRLLLRLGDFDYHPHGHLGHRYVYNFISTDTEGNNVGLIQIKVHEPVKLILPGCFGLLVLATDTRIHVCNPSTRRLLALPDSRSKMAGFGVGFLSSMREHKIVRLIPRRSRLYLECSVFTLVPGGESFSWRVLNDHCPYFVDQYSLPAFANETIYWKIDRQQALHRQNDFIVSFNVRYEKFQTITHPTDWIPITHPDWRSRIQNSTQLVELLGNLCMVETLPLSHIAVWKLADPRNSMWAKLCMIDLSRTHLIFVGELQCVKDGDMIFNSDTNTLLYYDVRKKTFRKKTLPYSVEDLTMYCESLASLTR
ncbi:unnamed protein product [Dovyalis caffra]|uniref:F-box associated beta-propeller type 3 domain-containing protein n=1 Tax=Dovyalis caffra TaxID=77055 RepID=A0AAV1RTL2_9ROSI|nr:unnamed protein product [Dovyalis caffra]